MAESTGPGEDRLAPIGITIELETRGSRRSAPCGEGDGDADGEGIEDEEGTPVLHREG